MRGLVGLHGGGEYVARDEAAMDALVRAAAAQSGFTGTVRVVLVPTAAARHRPDLALATGHRAFAAASARLGVPVSVHAADVVDRRSADDPVVAELLASADLVHLPGGDPDLIPSLLPGTRAWESIAAGLERGAIVAGASAGAMALADPCWTPTGFVDGLGVVPGLAVLPHFGPGRLERWRDAGGGEEASVAQRVTWLGLDERTLVLGRPGERWRVHGAGAAHLVPPGRRDPVVSVRSDGALDLGAS